MMNDDLTLYFTFSVIRGRFGKKCAELDHVGDYHKFKEQNDHINQIASLIKSINSDRLTVMNSLSTENRMNHE